MEVRPNETVDNSTQYRRHVPATPSKQPVVPPNTVETTSVSQRLQKELMSLMNCCTLRWTVASCFWQWLYWKESLRVGLEGVYNTRTIAEIKIELCFLPCQLMMAWTYLTLFLQMIGGDLGVSAFPEGESIFAWIGTIAGGEGTAYEGLSYKLSLRFPLDYPFKPPQIKFETMCFHPNVDQFGNICLDILQDKWSSAYDCRTILLSIQSLLGEPNPDSPLNSYAAELWSNKEDYKRKVHKQYYAGEAFES